jgi:hypothetical protein
MKSLDAVCAAILAASKHERLEDKGQEAGNPPLEGGSKPPKSDFSDLGNYESEVGKSRFRCGFGEGAAPSRVAGLDGDCPPPEI